MVWVNSIKKCVYPCFVSTVFALVMGVCAPNLFAAGPIIDGAGDSAHQPDNAADNPYLTPAAISLEPQGADANMPERSEQRSFSANDTPSGFKVPRYVSLKYGAVNGRSGPSQNHPVMWRYSRSGLPVIIVAETEFWRKVRDQNGDESWMHKRTLDGRRTVIALQEIMLRAKPRESASARAIAAKDSLFTLEACELGWCKVKADTGHQGYVPQKMIWGAQPL